jgi:rRNA maturation protein Rpf1
LFLLAKNYQAKTVATSITSSGNTKELILSASEVTIFFKILGVKLQKNYTVL